MAVRRAYQASNACCYTRQTAAVPVDVVFGMVSRTTRLVRLLYVPLLGYTGPNEPTNKLHGVMTIAASGVTASYPSVQNVHLPWHVTMLEAPVINKPHNAVYLTVIRQSTQIHRPTNDHIPSSNPLLQRRWNQFGRHGKSRTAFEGGTARQARSQRGGFGG